jgi:hypothetical protein
MKGMQQHAPGVTGRPVETVVEQHLGVLDETDLDPPVGMALAPLGGEMQGFPVAISVA